MSNILTPQETSDLGWVKLATKEALESEQLRMGHYSENDGCGDEYTRDINMRWDYYSLRTDDETFMVIEIRNGALVDCECKKPLRALIPALQSFVRENNWTVRAPAAECGLVSGRENANSSYRPYNIYELPSKLETQSEFDLTHLKEDITLPEVLVVNGAFFCGKLFP